MDAPRYFAIPIRYFSKLSTIIRRYEKTSYSKEVFQQKAWIYPGGGRHRDGHGRRHDFLIYGSIWSRLAGNRQIAQR